ncbi:MAG TPA: hypothetical protein VEY12_00105 [Thermoplasmata archaeon]|nr:hypothetical protein [Thermoplasmata archaeon]
MSSSASSQAHVGRRVTQIVVWTIVFIVGVGLGLLIVVPAIADALKTASASALTSTVAYVVAVVMILLGLWGISSSHRNLRHAIDLISEVDRARKETIQLETTRVLSKGK